MNVIMILAVAAVPVVSIDSLWLMGGGVFGAFMRAIRTGGQKNLGLETIHDCFLGALIGALWTVDIPGIGAFWPPFEFSATASQVQRALLVGAVVFIAVDGIKKALFKWGQKYLSKLGVENGNGTDTKSEGDKPHA